MSARPISSPVRDRGGERDRDRPAVAGGASARGQPPAHAGVDEREVGEAGVEADVGPLARDRPFEAKESWALSTRRFSVRMPALVADRPPRDRGRAGEQGVEAGVADGDVVGAALEGQVEAAAERGDAAVGARGRRRPDERAVGDPGEDRDVGDADGVAAV